MEKILIIADQPDKANCLIILLNTLFPDCRIHVVSSRIEALEEILTAAKARAIPSRLRLTALTTHLPK